ncbi:ABC transporter substrate-binding protein [Streptomyces albipurpureus]|uniref:ABC transporter substrate-binding protein n=1 Tax=Streptomyces albipurpureus TaxID=2897419 RepID=A0ABT0UZ60_9ACTN|nr:ABC transporter substrate-binding protein [Streptomyces sp. CWNU-1]MCM2393737.1 ABC transporter substrate-binding protein [Streptomyces sp. CWNU-1]
MARIPMTLACWDYDRTRALHDETVRPEGIALTYLPLMMPESAFRMLHFNDFDASEMSLSWYTRLAALKDRPFTAIPVFPSRMFRHSCIYVNVNSGIEKPADLVGKRVGCPEYQMTAAVWIKGMLADHYGVPVNSVRYATGGLEQPGRREQPMDLPADIVVEPIGDDRTLSEMLESGDIDALYTAHMPSGFARHSPNVRRLFEDYVTVEQDYYRRTGIFPIMHTVVIRQDVLEANPWTAQSLTKAFEESKQRALADLRETTALKYALPWLTAAAEEAREVLGDDYWPYGIDRNRETLRTFIRYSHEQGLIPDRIEPEALFAPGTLASAKI